MATGTIGAMKTWLPRRTASLALILGLLSIGCEGDVSSPDGGVVLTTASLGACTLQNGSERFPAQAKTVVLRIAGESLDEAIVETFDVLNAQGQAVVSEIPPGEGLQVEVVACTEDGAANWGGLSETFDLPAAGAEATVDIFLTPQDTFARTGRCSSESDVLAAPSDGHAYAAMVAQGEQTWIFGGFNRLQAESGIVKTLSATTSVETYQRASSQFTAAGALAEPRAMALVQPVAPGLVRLVGGVSSLRTAVSGLPNLAASSGPEMGVELYDTAAGTSVATLAVTFPSLPSVAAMDDGRALVVGGGDLSGAGPVYSAAAWLVPAGQPSEAEIEAGRMDLGSERYGATLVTVGTEALIWGGAAGDPTAARALWVDASAASVVPLMGGEQVAQTMFASGAHVRSDQEGHHFVVLGGAEVSVGHELAVNGSHAVWITVLGDTATVTPLDLGSEATLQLTRAGASLVPSPQGGFWFFGGYQSFGSSTAGLCPEPGPCMPADTLHLSIGPGQGLSVDQARSLRLPGESGWEVGAFGVSAAAQLDGSWLIVSGFNRVPGEGEGALTPASDAALIRWKPVATDLCTPSD